MVCRGERSRCTSEKCIFCCCCWVQCPMGVRMLFFKMQILRRCSLRLIPLSQGLESVSLLSSHIFQEPMAPRDLHSWLPLVYYIGVTEVMSSIALTDLSIALVLLPGPRKGTSAFSGSAFGSFGLGRAAQRLGLLGITWSEAG